LDIVLERKVSDLYNEGDPKTYFFKQTVETNKLLQIQESSK
jgi:hypothetical protein